MYKNIRYKYQKLDDNYSFYADVKYVDKDLAKSLGALWDYRRRLWYFKSIKERNEWDKLHSKDIIIPSENKKHKYVAFIDIDFVPSVIRKFDSNPITDVSCMLLDLNTFEVVRLCCYNISNSYMCNQTFGAPEDVTLYCSREEMILDLKNTFIEFNITEIFTYNGKNVKKHLQELNEYNWYDIKIPICEELSLPKTTGLKDLLLKHLKQGYSKQYNIPLYDYNLNNLYDPCRNSYRHKNSGKYTAMSRIFDEISIIKVLNKPIDFYYLGKLK